MKKIYLSILTLAMAAVSTVSVNAQDMHMLTAAGVTPQRHFINPAIAPEHSYMSLPFIGSLGLNVGTSIGYGSFIKGGQIDGTALADKTKNKVLGSNFSLDLISFGVRFREKNLISFSNRIRSNIGTTYPSGLFGYLLNNPIDYEGRFDIPLKSNNIVWNETAIGFSRIIDDNWSVGARVKYIMGIAQVNTNDTEFHIDKDITGSTIYGNVNITGGNLNFSKNGELVSLNTLASNPGAAFDVGVQWQSDDSRWKADLGVSDIGFIKWSAESSSRIYSKKSEAYTFNGFGNLHDVFGSSSMNSMLDSVYTDLMNSIELDTITGYAHTAMLPVTISVGGEFDVLSNQRHIVSLNFMGSFASKQPLYYALTAGYRYTSGNGRFSTLATLSHKRVDPISFGVGLMANTRKFQFFVLSDTSIATIFGGGVSRLKSFSYRMGFNFFFNKEKRKSGSYYI